jgi:hypothetical protein
VWYISAIATVGAIVAIVVLPLLAPYLSVEPAIGWIGICASVVFAVAPLTFVHPTSKSTASSEPGPFGSVGVIRSAACYCCTAASACLLTILVALPARLNVSPELTLVAAALAGGGAAPFYLHLDPVIRSLLPYLYLMFAAAAAVGVEWFLRAHFWFLDFDFTVALLPAAMGSSGTAADGSASCSLSIQAACILLSALMFTALLAPALLLISNDGRVVSISSVMEKASRKASAKVESTKVLVMPDGDLKRTKPALLPNVRDDQETQGGVMLGLVINIYALGLALMEAMLHEEEWAKVLGISENEPAVALTNADHGGVISDSMGGGSGSSGSSGSGGGVLLMDMHSGGSSIKPSLSSTSGASNGGGYPSGFVIFTAMVSLVVAARLRTKSQISPVAAWVLSTVSVAKLAVLLHPMSIVLPSTAVSMLLATAPFYRRNNGRYSTLSRRSAAVCGSLLFGCLLWNRHSLLATIVNGLSRIVGGSSDDELDSGSEHSHLHQLRQLRQLPPPAESVLIGACLVILGCWALAVCARHFSTAHHLRRLSSFVLFIGVLMSASQLETDGFATLVGGSSSAGGGGGGAEGFVHGDEAAPLGPRSKMWGAWTVFLSSALLAAAAADVLPLRRKSSSAGAADQLLLCARLIFSAVLGLLLGPYYAIWWGLPALPIVLVLYALAAYCFFVVLVLGSFALPPASAPQLLVGGISQSQWLGCAYCIFVLLLPTISVLQSRALGALPHGLVHAAAAEAAADGGPTTHVRSNAAEMMSSIAEQAAVGGFAVCSAVIATWLYCMPGLRYMLSILLEWAWPSHTHSGRNATKANRAPNDESAPVMAMRPQVAVDVRKGTRRRQQLVMITNISATLAYVLGFIFLKTHHGAPDYIVRHASMPRISVQLHRIPPALFLAPISLRLF